MKVRPIEDRIIIKQDPAQNKMGAFDLADTAKERPRQGTVMAVGSGRRNPAGILIPMICIVGDKVQYGEFAGSNVDIDGSEYVVVRESDLLFVL